MKHGAFTTGEFLVGPVLTNDRKVTFSVGIGAAISSFPSAYVNNRTGDDVHGDGTLERPFRTRERAAQALGLPMGLLTPLPRKATARPAAYGNRHERRAARARNR
jgi:hypothetical protein